MSLISFMFVILCGENGRDSLEKAKKASFMHSEGKGLKILFSSPFCLSMYNFMEESCDEWLYLILH